MAGLVAALSSSLLAQGTTSAKTAASTDLQRGEAALRANDKAAAAQYFRSALAHNPHSAEASANLGVLAFFDGDCAAAEPNLRNALKESPGLTKVLALLSICERRRNEPSGLADMEAAFAKLDDPRLRTQLGIELANGYYQGGDLGRTASVLQTLLQADPNNVDILFFAQRVYSELADTTLNKLAVLSPESARMEQLIAERLINAGDLKDATVHYRKAVELGPKLPGLHLELAETLLEATPNSAAAQTEARKELDTALQVDGDSSKIERQLGRIAMLRADTAQAATYFERATTLNPSDAEAQIGLSEVFRIQGHLAEAAEHLRLAVAGDPFNAEAHYKLSQLDRDLHLPEEQKKELQLFLNIRATRDKIKQLYREMNLPTANDPDPSAAATP